MSAAEWRSWHVHYADVDRLIVACAQPALDRVAPWADRRFWERHHAGGAHLRVRIGGTGDALERAAAEVEGALADFVARHPSADDAGYTPARAAALLAREGEEADPAELEYRNNVVLRRPYPSDQGGYVSPEAEEMARDFRHDAAPLAVALMTGERPLREAMLRLFFFHALAVTGDLAEGSVSFKSHWEGLAASVPPVVGERIRGVWAARRDGVLALLREVEDGWTVDRGRGDPVLAAWGDLIDRYHRRTLALLAQGKHVTPQPATLQEARELRDHARAQAPDAGRFTQKIWEDERFVASLQYEPAFLGPRVLVNLLYLLVSAAGLAPIDKMMLCHHAHAAVEEHTGRSLDALLERNVAGIVAAHAHRWA